MESLHAYLIRTLGEAEAQATIERLEAKAQAPTAEGFLDALAALLA